MEMYFEHMPYFCIFVALGIIANLFKTAKGKDKLTVWRIAEEVFGSIWIALVVAGLLDYFTPWSAFLIYGISSVSGYFHSYILDNVGKGILEFITVKVKAIINKKADEISDVGEAEAPDLGEIDIDEES